MLGGGGRVRYKHAVSINTNIPVGCEKDLFYLSFPSFRNNKTNGSWLVV